MEAHLAYRMAARMRAGPVRAPLGDMGWGDLGATRPLGSVLRSLARCSELLPPECCVALQVPDGSTYAEGARVVQDGIRAVQDVDAMRPPPVRAVGRLRPLRSPLQPGVAG